MGERGTKEFDIFQMKTQRLEKPNVNVPSVSEEDEGQREEKKTQRTDPSGLAGCVVTFGSPALTSIWHRSRHVLWMSSREHAPALRFGVSLTRVYTAQKSCGPEGVKDSAAEGGIVT